MGEKLQYHRVDVTMRQITEKGNPSCLEGGVVDSEGFLAKADLVSLMILQLTAMFLLRDFALALLTSVGPDQSSSGRSHSLLPHLLHSLAQMSPSQ